MTYPCRSSHRLLQGIFRNPCKGGRTSECPATPWFMTTEPLPGPDFREWCRRQALRLKHLGWKQRDVARMCRRWCDRIDPPCHPPLQPVCSDQPDTYGNSGKPGKTFYLRSCGGYAKTMCT